MKMKMRKRRMISLREVLDGAGVLFVEGSADVGASDFLGGGLAADGEGGGYGGGFAEGPGGNGDAGGGGGELGGGMATAGDEEIAHFLREHGAVRDVVRRGLLLRDGVGAAGGDFVWVQ